MLLSKMKRTLLLTATAGGLLSASGCLNENPSYMVDENKVVNFPGSNPGDADGLVIARTMKLNNNVIQAVWDTANSKLGWISLTDLYNRKAVSLINNQPFALTTLDGKTISSKDMKVTNCHLENLTADENFFRNAERFAGKQLVVEMVSPDGNLEATWRTELRNGANYMRSFITMKAVKNEIHVKEISLFNHVVPGAEKFGESKGSVICNDNFFLAYENPFADNDSTNGQVKCALTPGSVLAKGQSHTSSLVFGIFPKGQQRRSFLHYLEQEKVIPYSPKFYFTNGNDMEKGLEIVEDEMVDQRHARVETVYNDELKAIKVALNRSVFDAMTEISDATDKSESVVIKNGWASPFWALYANAVSEEGKVGFKGVGSDRQQWITHRDARTYQQYASNGSLFPLNLLTPDGVVFSKDVGKLAIDPEEGIRDEIRTLFAYGSQLQMANISPESMNVHNWNDLSLATHWAQKEKDVMIDTHWVGGDPSQLKIYGFAAWSAKGGASLTLRNPSNRSQNVTIDAQSIFELPKTAPQSYELKTIYEDQRIQELELEAGKPVTIRLKPYEVLQFH